MTDYDEGAPPVFDSRETTMTAEDVVISEIPEIIGNVVYRFGFRMIGSQQNFEVEITTVDVEDIKNPVYEDGSPVMMNEADRQKFTQTAYNYFWKKLVDKAEEKAMSRVQWGAA